MFIIYKPKRLAFVLIIILIACTFTTVFAQWEGWNWQQPITITNSSGSDLIDFQVKISLNSTNFDFTHANSDGSDLRVADNTQINRIPFWIEKWNPAADSAEIWVKVPGIPTEGTTIYLYYGYPTIPPPGLVETPPSGPFTKDPANPIIPIGDPAGNGDKLLAENIVYDDVTGHYWMVFANYRIGGLASSIGLVWSDDPTNPAAWHWDNGSVIDSANAPFILNDNGTWYIFHSDRSTLSPYSIIVATSNSVNGPYTTQGVVLQPGPAGSWEDWSVDEPFVFKRSDGKWILIYMGNAGNNSVPVEQVGYAIADNITGPYTKYSGNPCIPFGPPGSFDAGTIADPWVYNYHDIYYIGYTVSPIDASPWQTALATTSDWLTFNKHGIILPLGNEYYSFRGAVTRIQDEYVFSYTGSGPSGHYKLCIATQPVYQLELSSNPDAVFDFYDGFNGTSIDQTKWSFVNGNSSQTTVLDGLLTMTSSGTSSGQYPQINGTSYTGMNYIGETRARHPNQGTVSKFGEVGFVGSTFSNTVRILDGYLSATNWQRQASNGTTGAIINMSQTADQNWHIFHVYRLSPGTAGFQVDDSPVETVTSTVPTVNLQPFLMAAGNATNQFIVDWTRVRKYVVIEPTAIVGGEIPTTAFNVYLSSNTSATASTIYPNDSWGSTAYEPDDWDFTAPIELYIVPEVGSVFGASDITIEWDNTMYSYSGVENSGIFTGLTFQSLHSTNGSTDQVVINASRTDNINFTITAGQYIAKLNLNLLKPGYGPVSITDLDFRAFNGLGGQFGVSVTGQNSQLKSYLGDVASTVSTATGDGLVDFYDLTPWSVSYWSGVPPIGMANYKVKYDIGPTSTNNVYGVPAVDGKIQFEDFVIFAMSYGLSAGNIYPKIESEPTEPVDLQLGEPIIAGNQTRVPLFVSGGVQNVIAMSLTFSGQFGRLVSVEKGSLLNEFANPVMVMSNTDGNQVFVDLAVFGAEGVGINTEGEVLTLVFEGNTEININTAEVRNIFNGSMAVNISGIENLLPTEFALMQNYPNPFNPSTTINYELPAQAMVELSIFNALGEKVAMLVNEIKEAGRHTVEFNADGYSSGIYFYQMKANDPSTGSGQSFVSVKKMILMK